MAGDGKAESEGAAEGGDLRDPTLGGLEIRAQLHTALAIARAEMEGETVAGGDEGGELGLLDPTGQDADHGLEPREAGTEGAKGFDIASQLRGRAFQVELDTVDLGRGGACLRESLGQQVARGAEVGRVTEISRSGTRRDDEGKYSARASEGLPI
jgi:hypothetical protein